MIAGPVCLALALAGSPPPIEPEPEAIAIVHVDVIPIRWRRSATPAGSRAWRSAGDGWTPRSSPRCSTPRPPSSAGRPSDPR
jgi:hypothetical protein